MFDLAIVLSLLPLIMWGTGDYLAAKLSRKMSPFETNFVYSVYGILLPIILCIVYGFPSVSMGVVLRYFLVSILLTVGFLSMVKGFSKGATGLVAPIANAYAAVTLLASVVLFDATISSSQIAPMLVIVCGVAVVSYHKSKHRSKSSMYSVIFGLAAMLCFGLGFAVLSTVDGYRWYQNMLLLSAAAVVYASVLVLLFEKKHPVKKMIKASKSKIGFFGALAGSVGTLGLFAAIEASDNVVLVATIASAAPLCTAILAYKFEKERLTKRQRMGTVLVVGGVVLLNVVG